jgi:predicted tellurium resistance membrane protein TerC
MDWLTDPQIWAGLLTLTALEIVLGIDNLLFLAVLVARIPAEHQPLARKLGLGLALGARLALLVGISWIAHLTQPVFSVAEHGFSWRDLILIAGGFFLVYKGPQRSTRGSRVSRLRPMGQWSTRHSRASCCRSPSWISSSRWTASLRQ